MSFTMDADWLVFDPHPSTPSYVLPAGTVDAHCHVFGPGDEFPFASERKYSPCDASKDQLFALRDHLGVERNVIVQATCHGSDNAAMIDALVAAGGRARGVATVEPDVSDDQLAAMHHAGVRGVRFNYVRRLVDPEPDEYYRRIVERVAPWGWHVVLYFEAPDLAERWHLFTSFDTIVVIDHMGRPDVTKSVDGPEFGLFLRFMEENENVWSKISCPERLSVLGPPHYDDVVPFAQRVVRTFPERVLWGTDWPHPNLKVHMPDDGQLVNFLGLLELSDEQRHLLLVDNPNRLYWKEHHA